MARRYEIDDAQWEKIRPYLGNTPKKNGRPQVDNRKLLNEVLWIIANSVQTVFSMAERRKSQTVI